MTIPMILDICGSSVKTINSQRDTNSKNAILKIDLLAENGVENIVALHITSQQMCLLIMNKPMVVLKLTNFSQSLLAVSLIHPTTISLNGSIKLMILVIIHVLIVDQLD